MSTPPGPEAALQAALAAHLSADAGVRTVLGDPPRLHDDPPPGAAYPFAAFARAETADFDAGEARLTDHRLTIEAFTRDGEQAEMRAIMHALRDAAHLAPLMLAAPYHCVFIRALYADVFAAPSGRGWRGVLRLRAVVGQG